MPSEPNIDCSNPLLRHQWVQFTPAAVVALLAVLCVWVAVYVPPAKGEMGVVFPPWYSEVEAIGAIRAAGGRIVNSSRFPNIVIAYALDEHFKQRVGDEGALFTVAATGLCKPAPLHRGY